MTNETKPTAVIVDGYSTGNFLPDAFDRIGVQLVHVQSTKELMASMLLPDLNRYIDNIYCDRSEEALDKIRQHKPIAVLTGQEPGVPLTDFISEKLGLASNGTDKSVARRNKYFMIESLRDKGVRCAQQYKSNEKQPILDWVKSTNTLPCVIKPLSSASTDGVFICESLPEVADAISYVLSSKDIFEEQNQEVLVQSFLEGEEYIVDSVSVNGEVHICGIWKYEKNLIAGGKKIYDKDVLLDPDDPRVAQLSAYIKEVLPAMQIDHGPAHSEVIITPDGPTLVEIGARLNGNMNPEFHNRCIGQNQADLIAMCYTQPEKFLAEYAGKIYQKKLNAIVYSVATEKHGVIKGINQDVLASIEAMPSVHLVGVKRKKGEQLVPTIDLLTSPVRIFMCHESADQIQQDYDAIEAIKDEIYIL